MNFPIHLFIGGLRFAYPHFRPITRRSIQNLNESSIGIGKVKNKKFLKGNSILKKNLKLIIYSFPL